MEIAVIASALAGGLVILWLIVLYNRLVKARNQLREGWSGIEVQLKRRHDLIPALVECVKGYQGHERELLEEVARDRGVAQAATGASEVGRAERALGKDLIRIVALVEQYPELKADEVFLGLMEDLVEIEDHLQYARRYYNGSVRDLNNVAESFPANLVAGRFGFKVAKFFEVESTRERLPPDLAAALKGG
jgi:LemA protein